MVKLFIPCDCEKIESQYKDEEILGDRKIHNHILDSCYEILINYLYKNNIFKEENIGKIQRHYDYNLVSDNLFYETFFDAIFSDEIKRACEILYLLSVFNKIDKPENLLFEIVEKFST